MTSTAHGHITLVQEQRFRLRTDGGQSLLLTLGVNAPLGAADLAQLREGAVHVAVRYEGEPGLASGVAHNVYPD